MKHIKTYEGLNNYKVGDYVLLKYNNDNDVLKIVNIEYKWSNPYFLEYYENGKLSKMNCRKEDIERAAYPSEIEKYELQSASNKFNL